MECCELCKWQLATEDERSGVFFSFLQPTPPISVNPFLLSRSPRCRCGPENGPDPWCHHCRSTTGIKKLENQSLNQRFSHKPNNQIQRAWLNAFRALEAEMLLAARQQTFLILTLYKKGILLLCTSSLQSGSVKCVCSVARVDIIEFERLCGRRVQEQHWTSGFGFHSLRLFSSPHFFISFPFLFPLFPVKPWSF